MPQIKPYIAQTNIQGGFSTAQMSPEVEASQGKSLMQLGQGLSNVADAIKHVEDVAQTSDAAAKFAELRVQQTNKLTLAAKNGVVDQEKMLKEYNDDFAKLQDQFSSSAARGYLGKVNNELKSTIAIGAFSAQTELTRVKVLDAKQKQMSSWSAVLATDPTQLESITKEYDEYNAQMPLSAQMKEKMRYEDMKDLHIAEFRGRISALGGQGDVDKAVNSLNALKTSLEGGAFNKDRNFDSKTIRSLSDEITSEINGKEAEANRQDRLQEKAKKEQEDNLMNQLYSKLENDQLSAADIKKSGLDWTKKERLYNLLKVSDSRDVKINDSYYQTKLFNDIRSGLITDGKDIENAYVNKQITRETMGFLTGQLDFFKRPEGKQFSDELSSLNKFARSKIVNDAMGLRDPDGEKQYAMFQQTMMADFKKKRAEGISAQELLDPTGKSPNSLYNTVNRFQRSTQEKMDTMINSMNPQTQAPKFKSIDDYEASKGSK